jgi:CDP-glucose 4,6-dehydratase
VSNYLITGATGFVGGALARSLLKGGHTVTALVRDGQPPDGCRVVRGPLEDMQAVERAVVESKPNGVFHLGAQAIVGHAKRDPFSTFESNVRGTYNLLEAVRRYDRLVPTVVASSDKAYGETKVSCNGREPYQENDALEGRGFYDCSKSCTDLIAQSYAHSGMRVAVIRAGNIYGPGDYNMSRVVPSVIDDLINYRQMVIRSDGKAVRDYLYIDDAVAAYRSVEMYLAGSYCDGNHYMAFNVAGDEPAINVLDLVARIGQVATDVKGAQERTWSAGQSALVNVAMTLVENKYDVTPIVLGERSGEILHQVLDCSRARSVLNWAPNVKLNDGLYTTIIAAYGRRYQRYVY